MQRNLILTPRKYHTPARVQWPSRAQNTAQATERVRAHRGQDARHPTPAEVSCARVSACYENDNSNLLLGRLFTYYETCWIRKESVLTNWLWIILRWNAVDLSQILTILSLILIHNTVFNVPMNQYHFVIETLLQTRQGRRSRRNRWLASK